MKDKSLKHSLYLYLKARQETWINGGELEKYAEGLGFKGSNASRRCRELVGEKIERTEMAINGGVKSVYYRYVPSEYEVMHQRIKTGELSEAKLQPRLI